MPRFSIIPVILVVFLSSMRCFGQEADSSEELSQVTVTAQKKLIEHKIDRTVYNVETNISAIGGTAYDVLKTAPDVRVSNSDVGIAGKSSAKVMVNDKLLHLSGEELTTFLRTIAAANISKIEIITSPPAKYDAEGNSGIINIVLKKSQKDGFNGNISGGRQQNSLGSFFGSGSFNYRKGKVNIFGSGNGSQNFARPTESYTLYYPGETMLQDAIETNKHHYGRYELGMDYDLTPRSVIGFVYTFGLSSPSFEGDYHTRFTNTALDSFITTKTHTTERGRRNVVNLNYEWKIDTSGKKLKVNADYFTRTGSRQRQFTTQDFLEDGTSLNDPNTDRTTGTQVVNIKSVNTDLELPLHVAEFAFGGKLSFIDNSADNSFDVLQGDQYIRDAGKSDKFDYTENTQALYGSAKKKIDKWEFQLGLRGEYTQTTGHSETLNQTNTNDYFKLFPTVYLQYKADDDHSFNINYNRRINRPAFWDLNPFRFYTTQTSYSDGNPYLQPSFAHNLELSYSIGGNYIFTLFAQKEENSFSQVLIADTAGRGYHLHAANIGAGKSAGLAANVSLNPAKWWDCNLNMTAYYATFNSDYYGAVAASQGGKLSFNVETMNNFVLNKNKTLIAELNFEYQAANRENVSLQYATANLNGGIKALFLQKKLSVALNFNDLFATDKHKLLNMYNNSLTVNYYDEREVRVTLSYKFGGKEITSRQRRKSTDEMRRAGG